jgi:hypothetical protein
MMTRFSRYGYYTTNKNGRTDSSKLQGIIGHSKRKPKGPITLAPVRALDPGKGKDGKPPKPAR